MFDTYRKPLRSKCTTTVALLTLAFIFIPTVLLMSRPVSYFQFTVAIAGATLCLMLAWADWRWPHAVSPSKDGNARANLR
jgi:hypothetical protein